MATGTYVHTADITASIAQPFVGASASYPSSVQIDPQVYYNYADAQIVSLCRTLGVEESSIGMTDGVLDDVNLKEWGILQLYVKLYGDKMLAVNQDSYEQDKYKIAMDQARESAAVFFARITADSVQGNLASGRDARIRAFVIRRSS